MPADGSRRASRRTSPGAVGAGTQVESLFYSYPPPVAQAASLVAGVSDGFVLVAAGIGAVAGFALVVREPRGGRHAAPAPGTLVDVVLPALALAPFIYPFAIALLFGNVDAWFPLRLRRAAPGGRRGVAPLARRRRASPSAWRRSPSCIRASCSAGSPCAACCAGSATADPRVPGGLAHARRSPSVTDLAIVGLSVVAGGLDPWRDYIGVLRAGTGADFVSNLNIGPASQLALLLGDPSVAGTVAPVVALGAVLLTAAVAWRVRSAVSSLAVAAVLSLVLSPITWFHYPVALLPFGAWAWVVVRHGNGRAVVAGLLGGAVRPGRGGHRGAGRGLARGGARPRGGPARLGSRVRHPGAPLDGPVRRVRGGGLSRGRSGRPERGPTSPAASGPPRAGPPGRSASSC